jgi:putative ABC transport system permease protein
VLFVSLRDLQWRLRRFLIGVAATGLVFALALVITGISGSFHNEVGRAVDAFGADSWLVPQETSGPFTALSVFPEARAKEVSRGGVTAEPLLLFRTTVDTNTKIDVNLSGVRAGSFVAPKIGEGRMLRRSGEVVVDKSLTGIKLNQILDINDKPYRIVGRTSGLTYYAGTPMVFMDLPDLQKSVLFDQRLISALVVKGALGAAPAGMKKMTNGAVIKDLRRPLEKPSQTIDFVRVLLWIVAAGIIGSVLYLQAIERTRDFAVFKATGVTNRSLLIGLAIQAIALAISAAVAAIGLSFLLSPLMQMRVEIPGAAYLLLPIVAIIVGLVASLAGLRRAIGVDPALAFGGA